jgi:hypothetical protein
VFLVSKRVEIKHELILSYCRDNALQYEQKLLTGGVKSQVYNIQDGKILVSVDGAADSFDVKDFLLEQPEVDFVTLNSQKYSRPGKGADL